jgi:hypothetical protein
METWYYVVESIDGDYANLRRTDIESSELKLVARALLPEGISEGTNLKYELIFYPTSLPPHSTTVKPVLSGVLISCLEILM